MSRTKKTGEKWHMMTPWAYKVSDNAFVLFYHVCLHVYLHVNVYLYLMLPHHGWVCADQEELASCECQSSSTSACRTPREICCGRSENIYQQLSIIPFPLIITNLLLFMYHMTPPRCAVADRRMSLFIILLIHKAKAGLRPARPRLDCGARIRLSCRCSRKLSMAEGWFSKWF